MGKLMRVRSYFGRALRGEKGITGLETAIILIAFVVVASVFAYTVLSAGLFASQKSSESIYSGIEEAESSLELRGSVIAKDGAANDVIDSIQFTLSIALGGEPVDFTVGIDDAPVDGIIDTQNNVVLVNIITSAQQVNNIIWSKAAVGADDGDNLLDEGEQFQIIIGDTDGTGDLEDACTANTLSANEQFTIQVIPPTGATLVMERTLPAVIDDVNDLN